MDMSKSNIESLRAEAQVKRECAAKAFDAGQHELAQSFYQQAADREAAAVVAAVAVARQSIHAGCTVSETFFRTEGPGTVVRLGTLQDNYPNCALVRFQSGFQTWIGLSFLSVVP